jgi:hypothetical protein
MSQEDYDTAVALFIETNGVTRCPTACAVRTQGTVSPADRRALQQRAAAAEALRGRRRSRDPMTMRKPGFTVPAL